MRAILCALALLAGTVTAAQAETINPFECQQIGGQALDNQIYNANSVALKKKGLVRLICPFKNSMNGYLVRFIDDDGIAGSESFKVISIIQTTFLNDEDLYGTVTASCSFSSNFHYGTPGIAKVPCYLQTSAHSQQIFIIELWSRSKGHPTVQFYGIETWSAK